ncbi:MULTISPECIES: hypothetical protein [unclassified Methylobacterium]|uniref:hypothetical protein n=1 Tax=unclassified Methylobacterium TaxID=2615210 RepID=UPI0011C20065|nr:MULTISPECIES: hypothetical protein [unclassified Methylobacterium]QEE37980.1 hypothetical protein FVA80_02345 [Methylobacterium sp. WL1]TXN59820.1 hypothetical protein FV241_00175 [Methylobacterium sp. WL2]
MNAHTPLPTQPKRFRVDWAVEIDAASPHEAACFATEIMDQESTATVFSVEDLQTGVISVHDITLDGVPGENIIARRPEDTQYVSRTLRPGREYRTRDGRAVQILDWDLDGTGQLLIQIEDERSTGIRLKNGRVSERNEWAIDVFEVNPEVTKWLRMYDRKLNEAGKQVVGGKEYAAERGLFLYLFDTEAEARASLQGVRAVFPITYRDGDGLG